MGWLELVLIDEKEKRIVTTRGPNWIFDVVSRDPSNIQEFIELEERLYDMPSVFNDGRDPELIPDPNAYGAHGIERNPNNGGTLIVDLRKKEILVLGHPQISDAGDSEGENEIEHVRDPKTGEIKYVDYGFISKLRKGVTYHSKDVERKRVNFRNFFGNELRVDLNDPQNPTRENPERYWISEPASKGYVPGAEEGDAILVERWNADYEIPATWKIIDEIEDKEY